MVRLPGAMHLELFLLLSTYAFNGALLVSLVHLCLEGGPISGLEGCNVYGKRSVVESAELSNIGG